MKKEKGQTTIEFMLIMIFMLLFTALFLKLIHKGIGGSKSMAEVLKEAILDTLYERFFCTFN
ncbi:MAG: hypothetical protein ACUVUG_03570 [Candidatus Aminicenantia bacterium]